MKGEVNIFGIFSFLPAVKFFFVLIQWKGNEPDVFNVITEKGTLRCLLNRKQAFISLSSLP